MPSRQAILAIAERATKYRIEGGVLFCRCPSCRQHLPLETEFHLHRTRANGYSVWCKSCGNAYRSKHR